MRITAFFLALFSAILFLSGPIAEAIPAFSKKYEAPCELCHSVWPKLNETGINFKINGFQMPGSEDGAITAKRSLEDRYFFNIGPASPPISLRFNGAITVSQPQEGEEGFQGEQLPCCADETEATAIVGGTVGPNIGYYLSLPWSQKSVEQGYVRFVNWFGPGILGLDLGKMSVIDYDASSPLRDWFSSPSTVFNGHPYTSYGDVFETGSIRYDTGVRLYGKPGFDRFSYEVGAYTGKRDAGLADDDGGFATTIMGRADLGPLAISLRYWTNTTGATDLASATGGVETVFAADPYNPDETTSEVTFAARYHHSVFDIDFVIDNATHTMGSRIATGADGAERTLDRDDIYRLGISVEGMWTVNNWLLTGLSYGTVTINDYDQAINDATETITGYTVSMFEWRAELRPASNMRIGVALQYDLSGNESRIAPDGESKFDLQSKGLLTWDIIM